MPGTGTKADPWTLKIPPGTSDYTIYLDDKAELEHHPKNNRVRAK